LPNTARACQYAEDPNYCDPPLLGTQPARKPHPQPHPPAGFRRQVLAASPIPEKCLPTTGVLRPSSCVTLPPPKPQVDVAKPGCRHATENAKGVANSRRKERNAERTTAAGPAGRRSNSRRRPASDAPRSTSCTDDAQTASTAHRRERWSSWKASRELVQRMTRRWGVDDPSEPSPETVAEATAWMKCRTDTRRVPRAEAKLGIGRRASTQILAGPGRRNKHRAAALTGADRAVLFETWASARIQEFAA